MAKDSPFGRQENKEFNQVGNFRKNQSNKKKSGSTPEGEPRISRTRVPRGKEVIGIVEQRFGGSKMMVKCADGKPRNCRVPGRLKRRLWLREGDFVLIDPWEFDNERGDIIYKYRPNETDLLKRNGLLKSDMFEF